MVGPVVMEWSQSIHGMFNWDPPAQPRRVAPFSEREKVQILVTGGAGYIGSHTAKLLARAGYEPIALDNLSTGHRWAVQWGPFVQAVLQVSNLFGAMLGTSNIQAFIILLGK